MMHEDQVQVVEFVSVAKQTTRKESVTKWGIIIAVCLFSTMVRADSSDAAGVLGESTCAIVNVLTNKWLFGVGMLAIIGGLSTVLFGGEMTDAIKKLVQVIVVIGFIMAAAPLLTLAFASFKGMSC